MHSLPLVRSFSGCAYERVSFVVWSVPTVIGRHSCRDAWILILDFRISLYRWVSHWKTICSIRYFRLETLFYRYYCRKNIFSFIKLMLLCGLLQVLSGIFNFFVSTFYHPDHLQWDFLSLIRSGAVTYCPWRRGIWLF